MKYEASLSAVVIFALFVFVTLAISFYFARKTSSAKSYFAAGGQIHWFVNGVAFAGDYLSAASFLGICGMIAFYGYDGFLYSIGYLAGWVVALFVVAEPLKRLGKYTFADALDAKFGSPGIKLAAGISTLVVSIFYLIPQMVGAGALVKPLLGFDHAIGVCLVGAVVVMIVVTAGMVSTTYVQFLKGSLLVVFSTVLTVAILNRGLVDPSESDAATRPRILLSGASEAKSATEVAPTGDWSKSAYSRTRDAEGIVTVWKKFELEGQSGLIECQASTITKEGKKLVNGKPWGKGPGEADFFPVGTVAKLPGDAKSTGKLGPLEYLSTLEQSTMLLWAEDKKKITEADGSVTTVYYPTPTKGSDVLMPGNSPTFAGLRAPEFSKKLNFLSLMLALFFGTASLPHILIRYYTVKDQAAARKSTVVGIASIGFFYVLTLFIGLGAMTSGAIDVTNSNMAAPLLAKSIGETLFAIISAIAFTTVLGTVAGLIVAASGAVVHDLLSGFFKLEMDDHKKVRFGRIGSVVVGVIAIILGILFEKMNVTFLVGWAFSVAASANMPSLATMLFWKGTTRQGIIAGILVGMVSSLGWVLLSADAYKDVYGLSPDLAPMPFSQPGIVTIPLGFATVILVSLLTKKKDVAVPTAR
ncbi:MAG: cation acetate symporter [Planctomycetia bacterium]|nr:cation acetate symporter [Planctomycetia bacterium]